jgi:hypothetical protein
MGKTSPRAGAILLRTFTQPGDAQLRINKQPLLTRGLIRLLSGGGEIANSVAQRVNGCVVQAF